MSDNIGNSQRRPCDTEDCTGEGVKWSGAGMDRLCLCVPCDVQRIADARTRAQATPLRVVSPIARVAPPKPEPAPKAAPKPPRAPKPPAPPPAPTLPAAPVVVPVVAPETAPAPPAPKPVRVPKPPKPSPPEPAPPRPAAPKWETRKPHDPALCIRKGCERPPKKRGACENCYDYARLHGLTAQLLPAMGRRANPTKVGAGPSIFALLQKENGPTLARIIEATGYPPNQVQSGMRYLFEQGKIDNTTKNPDTRVWLRGTTPHVPTLPERILELLAVKPMKSADILSVIPTAKTAISDLVKLRKIKLNPKKLYSLTK